MNPRIRSRMPASIGSNQASPANKDAACAACVVVLSSPMAWSPPARQRRSWLAGLAGDYAALQFHHLPDGTDIVFYTGCNVTKTPHIALLVLEVLDALGVSYEVMGGNAVCCGIQQFKRGDAKTAGRVSYNTIDRLSRPGASRVVAWCPSCQIQIAEVALPAYRDSFGTTPFDMNPLAEFFAERLDD